MPLSPEEIQREYYAKTAAQYDDMHMAHEGGHDHSYGTILAFARQYGFTSALDVGAGTGRTMKRLCEDLPDADVYGIEPVAELAAMGHAKGLSPDHLKVGSGYALPFETDSVDMAVITGVLHHVERPGDVIAEMCRVARQAVFISDGNRFGQGRVAGRLVKLGLHAAGLWPLANRIKTRGKGYAISEGDGLFYSYSVYDNVPQLQSWADRFFIIPTKTTPKENKLLALGGPLLTAGHVLACALKGEQFKADVV